MLSLPRGRASAHGRLRKQHRGHTLRRVLALAVAGVLSICTTVQFLAKTFVGGAADPSQLVQRLRPSALLRVAADPSDAPVASIDAEVVTESRSRPLQLLHSPGVQELVGVLRRLRDAPGSTESKDGSALQVVLGNLGDSSEAFLNREIPEHFQDDAEEIVAVLSTLVESVATDSGREAWQIPLQEMSRLQALQQRLPAIVDELLPWDIVYPRTLANQTGVRREELSAATSSFIRAVKLEEIATWSEEELVEASELVEKDEILSEVAEAVEGVIDGAMVSVVSTFSTAWITLLAFLVLVIVAIGNCFGVFSGAPGGSEVSVPADLPLYKLGGSSGGGVPTPTGSNLGVVPLYQLSDVFKP